MLRVSRRADFLRGGQIFDAEQYQPNPAAANRGLELLGRELGMFTEKHKFETEIDRVSDEELDESIRRRLENWG